MPRIRPSAQQQFAAALQQIQQASAAGTDAVVARESRRRSRDPGVIKEEGLRSWADYDALQGDPNYFGMNAGDWLQQQETMMHDIARNAGHMDYVNPRARQVQDLAAGIARDYNISEAEALKNIQRLVGSRNGIPLANAVEMGVPSAHADEKMSLAALEMSGFENPRMMNQGSVMATDLAVDTPDGATKLIDAQKLISRSNLFNLGALQNVETDMPIAEMLARMPGRTPVLEALQQLQAGSRRASDGRLRSISGTSGESIDVSGNEDKLMQAGNRRFNPNPSETFLENEDLLRKDGLIWTDRSNFQPDFSEFRNQGPFDAAPAKSMNLVDLDALRGTLEGVTLDDMRMHDVEIKGGRVPGKRRRLERDARDRGHMLSDVKLVLPKRLMTQFAGDLPPLTQEALSAFTTR